MSKRAMLGAAAAALLAGCASRPAAVPAPAAPAAAAMEVPVTPPPPAAPDWPDRPLSLGDWSYADRAGGSEARFAGLSLRCDAARREILLSREGARGPVRVNTSYGQRTLAPAAALPAGDPLLDEIAFSRGRFAIEAEGAETLIAPAWPEPGRVIEDCRG